MILKPDRSYGGVTQKVRWLKLIVISFYNRTRTTKQNSSRLILSNCFRSLIYNLTFLAIDYSWAYRIDLLDRRVEESFFLKKHPLIPIKNYQSMKSGDFNIIEYVGCNILLANK